MVRRLNYRGIQKSCLLILLSFLLPVGCASFAWAGGGPEDVFLVVNSADSNSQTIANQYVEWRKIPQSCVFYIDWPAAPPRIDVSTFRSKLLEPILAEIERRKLKKQIDYVVYSSGFPYAVNFSADLGDPSEQYPIGSLTSLTYYYETVLKKRATYRVDRAQRDKTTLNTYAVSTSQGEGLTRGFNSQVPVGPSGRRVTQGPHYYLSMMLGYTRGKASNSLLEVSNYLMRGVTADGSQPKGTVYFVSNSDARSTPRHDKFSTAVSRIQAEGVDAESITGDLGPVACLPQKKSDVMGAMIGQAKFTWREANSTILPGAICENLTSTGGVLSGSSQTLLCEFLRFGAVASSGTVTEPYNYQEKFPHPFMHLHYVRGCSVAESFYQSVLAPYQLIMVGDPLCQPFAVAPEVSIAGVDSLKPVSGLLKFKVQAKSKERHDIKRLEVFVDGVLASIPKLGEPVVCDTSKLPDGHHELRVVAVEDSNVETQGRAITSFISSNNSRGPSHVAAHVIPRAKSIKPGGRCMVTVSYPNAREVRLYRGRTLLGKVQKDLGQITVSASKLGGGSSMLTPVAIPSTPGAKPVFGAPVKVRVRLGLGG